MHYFLRPATNDDRDAIERLVFTALAEHRLKPDPSGTDADLHDIQASYFEDGGAFDLLVDGSGQVVGSVGLCRVSDSTCELRKMYLAPEVRGCGWGRRPLEHGLARASEVMKNAHKIRVQPNDIVIFANQLGTWKVVAPVNGSKADIRRNGGFDTRIVTARLESLTLIRGAGSPEYSY